MSRNSNSIVLSVKTRWCDLILSGRKTIEIRRGCWPENEWRIIWGGSLAAGNLAPLDEEEISRRVYIYRTGKNGAIVGEFECGLESDCFVASKICSVPKEACMTQDEFLAYIGDRENVLCICINRLKVYDEPRTLADVGLKRAPQSWCYARKEVSHDA